MQDVMIDIEALSTQLGAVVLTIGAVIFDIYGKRSFRYVDQLL
ncbi:hypothetical protein ACJU26_11280 [Acidithiobacillus sp. M4-SHS-6]